MKIAPPFAVEYRHNGSLYGITVGGDSWEEAQEHLRSIGANGRVVGSNVTRYSVNALNLPFIGLWVRLKCWWRNLRG
jgi:hypothetical protein